MDLKGKNKFKHETMIINILSFLFPSKVLNFSCQTSQQLKNNSYLVVRRGLLVLREKFKVESWHLLCNFFSNKFSLVTFSRNKDKCFAVVFQMLG